MDSPNVSLSTKFPPGVEILERVGEEGTEEQTVVDLEEGVVVNERLEDNSAVSVVSMGQGKNEICDFSSPGGG